MKGGVYRSLNNRVRLQLKRSKYCGTCFSGGASFKATGSKGLGPCFSGGTLFPLLNYSKGSTNCGTCFSGCAWSERMGLVAKGSLVFVNFTGTARYLNISLKGPWGIQPSREFFSWCLITYLLWRSFSRTICLSHKAVTIVSFSILSKSSLSSLAKLKPAAITHTANSWKSLLYDGLS